MKSKSKKSHHSSTWLDDQAKHHVCGFFALLLKIDKRNNPQNYAYQKNRDHSNQAS
ncbi:hypothetical protein [Candidatus Protochlamydia sp. W-9]|uniref:hypothetical protein n=1 Tax=Candidatus Protochlamydia sp. W-9 TaxID=1785087 RepID=UPI001301190A|nr:hypothetical protein [Candidatus Protochlamydia sp. W-9]